YKPLAQSERAHYSFSVKSDGSYDRALEIVYRILTAKGASSYASLDISYIPSKETLGPLNAWTVSPGGMRIAVADSAIRDRDEDNSGGSSNYSDTKYKSIIYPDVAIGSLVGYRVKSHIHTASYPGEFAKSFFFSPALQFKDWELNVTIPAPRKLYIESRGVNGGLVSSVDGISHYKFTYRRTTVIPPQHGAAGELHYADYLFVSTMPDMRALGKIAKQFFAGKAEITPEIQALADSLVSGESDERSKARALYTWVAKNIRYVAISVGEGRLAPRPATKVLKNKYGDCKDHVVLLEALLSAAGIQSSPALINSGTTHLFAKIGVHYPIDHAITYIPSLDLYLDSTNRFVPFGTLPEEVVDKPVVLLNDGKIGRTPIVKAEENVSVSDVSLEIQPDGSIKGNSSVTMTGHLEHYSRYSRFSSQSRHQPLVIKALLERFNEAGTGSLTYTDPTAIDKPYRLVGQFILEPLTSMPGRGGLAFPIGLSPGFIYWAGMNSPAAEQRFPKTCTSQTYEDRISMTFPSNVEIEEIPKGVRFNQGGIRYESRYKQSGRTVTAHRSLRVQHASSVCGAKEHQEWKSFYRVLQRDVRAQIIYR
ncbi:MAG: DUF3857 domain-containing protein, partial [Quisquiliibacterium sp.]